MWPAAPTGRTLPLASCARRATGASRPSSSCRGAKNAALNQGLAAASAGTLVLLDADSEVSPEWLKGLVGALQGDVAASTGNYVPMHETPVSLWGDLAKVYEYEVRGRVILQGSGGIAVRREALEVIGPFPEERISSDWDLDARLALGGYRGCSCPGPPSDRTGPQRCASGGGTSCAGGGCICVRCSG